MKVVKNIFFGIKIFFKCIYVFFAFLVTGIFLLEAFSTLFSSVYRNWFNVSQVIVFVC